ncbi:hypothetical protein SAMN05444162_0041 [Paenibacillaceae bacterium GAS479]|nr:hypothetical protein SAMN05444162_0041 [Paenibacillaceae bacterium GAS479]
MKRSYWQQWGIWILPLFVVLVAGYGYFTDSSISTRETFEWMTDYISPWIIIFLLLVLLRRKRRE